MTVRKEEPGRQRLIRGIGHVGLVIERRSVWPAYRLVQIQPHQWHATVHNAPARRRAAVATEYIRLQSLGGVQCLFQLQLHVLSHDATQSI